MDKLVSYTLMLYTAMLLNCPFTVYDVPLR